MPSVSLDCGNLRVYGAELAAGGAKLQVLAGRVLRKSTYDGQRIAQSLTPVDTGNLKNSFGAPTFSGGGSSISGEFGPTAYYGGYVDEGTSRMAPQPYMGPATDQIEPLFIAAVDQLAGLIL